MSINVESLREARKKRLVITLLTVYADDSADAEAKRVFAIAGIMGTQEEWDALAVNWLTRTNGKIFHGTDCESGYNDYKGIPQQERLKEYADLTKLLANTKLMGFGASLDVQGYYKYLPHAFDDGPYFQCFIDVVKYFAKQAFLHIPQQTVKFIFDNNHKVKYNAAYLYNNLIPTRKDWKYICALEDEIGFATQKTVGIQVADLFAREVMKLGKTEFGYNNRRMRASLKTLFDTNRFKCIYRFSEWFKEVRDKYESLSLVAETRKDFQNWLKRHKCQDNIENRSRYLMSLETKEK